MELQRLGAGHADALLAFERENRAYFAASIPDRGDAYFERFGELHRALLAEQEAGECHFHVLAGADGAVWGRFNLVDVADGAAELGFRVAAWAAGRGVARDGVRRVCEVAVAEYGLSSLRARAAVDNVGSRMVLVRSGFRQVGEVELNGRPGLRFTRALAE
ncbi:GNAT family N-acetyltransferase [Streptomyces sp. NPDC093085]|uniref:GNAT family N-acetyltransferase n=1 Tax=Streptomyces sp. NPDC093085 TaxID=3155068 RepID=UPI0034359447